MNFAFIDQLIGGFPSLEILERSTNRKNILLYQHEGTLTGNATRIGNHTNVDARLRSFFVKARETNVALAIAPEYCCPLAIADEVVGDPQRWPVAGKLWVVGGESITKDEIKQFKQKYTSVTSTVHFEEGLFNDAKTYFDPAFILFTTNGNGAEHLNVIVQFKTKHMGVWGGGVVERDNLIEGTTIYILRNSATSTRLITLICSEAMNFPAYINGLSQADQERLHWDDMPYLILNPMVNPQPAFPDFVAFRKFVFQSDNKEIIELNWNNQSKLGGDKLLKYDAARSGVFVKSNDIDQKNKLRIRANHKLGMYYYFIGPRKYAFLLNGKPNLYLIACPSVSIIGAQPVQSMREGPQLLEAIAIDNNGVTTPLVEVSDDHIAYLVDVGCGNAYANDATGCVIDKERLACLTAGEIPEKPGPDWYLLDKLISIKLDDTIEVNRRFTVTKDSQPDSKKQRRTFAKAIDTLNNKILVDPNCFPASIADLKGVEIVIGYATEKNKLNTPFIEVDRYKYNIATPDGQRLTATLCFLDMPETEEIELKFEHLQTLFDQEYNNRGRVVIFYEKDGKYVCKWDPLAGKYGNTDDNTGPSFLKDA